VYIYKAVGVSSQTDVSGYFTDLNYDTTFYCNYIDPFYFDNDSSKQNATS
jgi:hypothetical protein